MGEGDHFSRSVRACHGCALHVPVLSVPGDSPCHPQAAENHWTQAKSKKRWRGSVLHTVTSSFYSLKSEAGVKPLGSHTVLWCFGRPGTQTLCYTGNRLRKAGDCFALRIFLLAGWAGPLQFRLHIPSRHLEVGTYSRGFKTCWKVAREAAPLLSHNNERTHPAPCAGFGCLFCYRAENNVSLIWGEFDLKEERFTIHIVIGPTFPLPNAPDTGISFIPLTFYYLVNLSCYLDTAKSCR